MALEETFRHWMFSLPSCSLAEKVQNQPAVTSPTWVLGILAWKVFKVPYSLHFVSSSIILVIGSLTLGNCLTCQGKLFYGRCGHNWISAVKGIYCWARSRKLQSLFLSFITNKWSRFTSCTTTLTVLFCLKNTETSSDCWNHHFPIT